MTDEHNSVEDGISKVLQETFKNLEGDVQKTLEGLREIEILSHAMLQREADRLSRKLGSDDPRVQRLEIQLANKLSLIKVLEAEVELVKIRVLEVDPDEWIVHGEVVDGESKQGMGGVMVSLYDKDVFFDDILGASLTDSEGYFEITYRIDAFRDLFETRPDLYVKVLDDTGKTLYCSRKCVRPEAGRVETYYIIINGESGDNDADD
ncbi:MAG: hypothetical protein ACWGQW_26140 [bacterium]